MQSKVIKHTLQLAENRLVILAACNELTMVNRTIQGLHQDRHGNESWAEAGNVIKSLGTGMLSVASWTAGKTGKMLGSAVTTVGDALTKTFSDNDALIKALTARFSSVEEKRFQVTKKEASFLSVSGKPADIVNDVDLVLKTLESFLSHNKDVLSYLDKKLSIVRGIKSVNDINGILSIIEQVDELPYPEFNLGSGKDTLPGGTVLTFELDDNTPVYSMETRYPDSDSGEVTLTKSELNDLLSKVSKINSCMKRIKASYDDYLKHIKSWSSMVTDVDKELSKKERLSASAITSAEKVLSGDVHALSFYSGFTPRVVSYTDKYIHGVLGVFA